MLPEILIPPCTLFTIPAAVAPKTSLELEAEESCTLGCGNMRSKDSSAGKREQIESGETRCGGRVQG